MNGDTGNNDLIYIPTDEEVDRMTFSPTSAYTAEQQKANFKAWLSRDEYMKEHRGEYSKRNAGNEKLEHHFDFHLSHRLQFMLGKSKRELRNFSGHYQHRQYAEQGLGAHFRLLRLL